MDLAEVQLEESSDAKAAGVHNAVAGLFDLLQSVKLASSLTAALAWCDENGAESIEDVVEHGMIEDFVDALELKLIQKKKLLNRLQSLSKLPDRTKMGEVGVEPIEPIEPIEFVEPVEPVEPIELVASPCSSSRPSSLPPYEMEAAPVMTADKALGSAFSMTTATDPGTEIPLSGGFGLVVKGCEYELIERLNAIGGNAEVWKAKRLDFESTCVVKKTSTACVEREVRARKIMGTDTYAIYALEVISFEDNCLVLEFAKGTLADRLLRPPKMERHDLLKTVTALVRALDHFQSKRLVHTDIKPENIFQIVPNANFPEDFTWKLGDFDQAELVGELVTGYSAHWAAPEVVTATQNGTQMRAASSMDVWSLGAVMLSILEKPLFANSVPPDEVEEVLANVGELEKRLLDIKQSFTDLNVRSALDAMLQTNPIKRIESNELLRNSLLTGAATRSILRQANSEVMEKIDQSTKKIVAEVQKVGASVLSNSSMLGALLQGEHDCPRWLVMVPKPKTKGAFLDGWLKPSNWANKTVILYFVCPVTMSAVGSGFELLLTKASLSAWMKKYGPALRVGMSLLTLAARAGGLPIPNLADVLGDVLATVEKQTQLLKTLADGIAEELTQLGLDSVNTWAEETLEAKSVTSNVSAPPELATIVQQSYGQVRALLDSLEPKNQTWEAKLRDPKRCGLVKAVCTKEEGQPYEWVAPQWKSEFEQKGRSLLEEAPDHAQKAQKAREEGRAIQNQVDLEKERMVQEKLVAEEQRKRAAKLEDDDRKRAAKREDDELKYKRKQEEKERRAEKDRQARLDREEKERKDREAEAVRQERLAEKERKDREAETDRRLKLVREASVASPQMAQVLQREIAPTPPVQMETVTYWGVKTWLCCLLSGGYACPCLLCCPLDEKTVPANLPRS